MLYDKTFSDFMYSSTHLRSTDYSRSDIVKRSQDLLMPVYVSLYDITFTFKDNEWMKNLRIELLASKLLDIIKMCNQSGIGLMRVYTPLSGYYFESLKINIINHRTVNHIDDKVSSVLTHVLELLISLIYSDQNDNLNNPRYVISIDRMKELINKSINSYVK